MTVTTFRMGLKHGKEGKPKFCAVMADGDLSTLESSQDWDRNELNPKRPLYYKERGEKCPAIVANNKLAFFALTNQCGGEYTYLFSDGKWVCYGMDGNEVTIPANLESNTPQ
jgi:hypothetical protein